jgi:hypothetical protein
VIGHDCNTTIRVLAPEQLDFFHRGAKIVAGMNDEKQWLVQLEFARDHIIGT